MVKPGGRALGIAESYTGETSTVAGAVVRANRVVDGLSFAQCTVGGRDGTETVVDLVDRLDRPDVQYLLLAGIAPAWFNVLDLLAIHEATDRPVLSVSFEESEGLSAVIREEFDGEARAWRLATYRAQPVRHAVTLDGDTVFVRSVGLDDSEAEDVVRAFTPAGGRPEPLRVARMAARAADAFARRE